MRGLNRENKEREPREGIWGGTVNTKGNMRNHMETEQVSFLHYT